MEVGSIYNAMACVYSIFIFACRFAEVGNEEFGKKLMQVAANIFYRVWQGEEAPQVVKL